MRLPYATIASFIAGGAAVGFATGTGMAPNPFATADLQPPVAVEQQGGFDEARAALDSLTEQLTMRAAELERLSGSLNARDTELQNLTESLARREARLEEESDALAARDADLQSLQTSLTARETALSDAETILTALRASLAEREQSLDLRESRLIDLETVASPGGDPSKILPSPSEPQTEHVALAVPAATSAPSEPGAIPAAPPLVTASATPTIIGAGLADGKMPIAEVHFESASASLTPGGLNRALQAAERLSASKNIGRIRIAGHTDTLGSPTANRALGQARAEAVADVFVQAGLSREMIEIVGFGETPAMLPVPTADGVAEPLNRCVGIYAMSTPGDVPNIN